MANTWIEMDVYGYADTEEARRMEALGLDGNKPGEWAPMLINMSQVAYVQRADDTPKESELTMAYGGTLVVRTPPEVIFAILRQAGDIILMNSDSEDLPEVKIIGIDKDKDGGAH